MDLVGRTIARTVDSPCGGPETGSSDVMSFGPDPDMLYFVTYTGIQVIDVRTGNITDPADFTELQGAVAFVRAPVIPKVAAVSPAKGAEAGGSKVVITGTHMSTTTAVYFGGTAASSFTIDSDTQVTAVTITGERFTGTFRVDVGGVAASYTLDSDSEITIVTPPGPAGTVGVTVTTDVGTSAAGAADSFIYTAPA